MFLTFQKQSLSYLLQHFFVRQFTEAKGVNIVVNPSVRIKDQITNRHAVHRIKTLDLFFRTHVSDMENTFQRISLDLSDRLVHVEGIQDRLRLRLEIGAKILTIELRVVALRCVNFVNLSIGQINLE